MLSIFQSYFTEQACYLIDRISTQDYFTCDHVSIEITLIQSFTCKLSASKSFVEYCVPFRQFKKNVGQRQKSMYAGMFVCSNCFSGSYEQITFQRLISVYK